MCEKSKELLEGLTLEQLKTLAAKAGISEGQLAGGLKGTCGGCPFNAGMTEEADMAQNYGCLPTAGDIVALKRETGANWACHSDETKVCAGLCHAAKAEKLDLASGGLISYQAWYHEGPEAVVRKAVEGAVR